jgi:amino acid transporter
VLKTSEVRLAHGRRMTLAGLTFVTFFTTCGGAFGIEPLVGAVGPGWAVVLLFVTPLVWSLPIALMVAELATLMPEEGGYYIWVREALGPFWAVQAAWWSLGYSALLLAIWPVLFVNYLEYLVPWIAAPQPVGAGPVIRWLIAVLVIASAMTVNLRGARGVGRSAQIGAALVFGAFLLLIATWLVRGPGPATAIAIVAHDLRSVHKGALLLGLSILILNYSGWDSVSTFASEVDRPRRNYPLALGGALILAIIAYTVPVIAGVSVTTDPAAWSAEAGWPAIAGLIGGRWLGLILAGAGLVSTWGLFDAQLLYVSRIPYVMARDGWLPKSLSQAHSDTAVPKAAIVGFCLIVALLAIFSFGNLVVMMCLLYTATLLLEFLALVAFRVRLPHADRPFRVPGGPWGLMYVCLAPIAVAALVLREALRDGDSYAVQLGIVASVVVAGVALYGIRYKYASALRAVAKAQEPWAI